MSVKDTFSSDEWSVLESAPMGVFISVANADGKIDKKEIKAFISVLKNHNEFGNELTQEVLRSVGNKYDENENFDKVALEENLKKVAEILEQKIDFKEALNFKKTLIATGIHVGNSSGGLFASKFSEEEVEALKKVGSLLGVTESQLQQSPSIRELIQTIQK